MGAGLPTEFQFVLRALRLARGTGDLGSLTPETDKLDWGAVVAGIGRHGVGWISSQLLGAPGLVPADAATALRKITVDQAVATMERARETVRVATALSNAGFRFLIVKGAPLSVQLHGDPARRPARDIDILVEPGRAVAVEALMFELGYMRPDGGAAEDMPEGISKETGYVHTTTRILVEIHDRLTDNFDLLPWHFEELWSERVMVNIGTASIPTLAPARLPVYLCVHGAAHCWARLIWLEDLAKAMPSDQAIAAAMTAARSVGLEPLLLHGLHMLYSWLGHPVPKALLDQAARSRQVRTLNAIVTWFHNDPRWFEAPARGSWRRFRQGSVQSRAFSYAMKTSVRYLRSQISMDVISGSDRKFFRLPPYLTWLYVPLRPAGWLLRRL